MKKNTKKRLIISMVYLVFIIGICWFLYSIFKSKPSCFDGSRNQNEEGVDCGGVCAKKCEFVATVDLQVKETGLIGSSTTGEYDFYGIVSNPNMAQGSDDFSYRIVLEDASGAVLGEKSGDSYILPGEEKYIIENNILANGAPTKAELVISNPHWIEFYEYYKKPELNIVNLSYNEITSGVGYYEVKGLLENKSPFDFNVLKVKIIVKDFSGKIIALNSTAMGTVLSGEDRDFRVFWPGRFAGEVGNVETQIEVNVFKSDSFAQKFFKEQKFQEYSK